MKEKKICFREPSFLSGNLEILETRWYKTGVKKSELQWKDERLWLVTEWDADGKITNQYNNKGDMGE
jgi:antitoxin component YwqK of YwqJK toxin-antitoxin module